ncbi:MAG: recombinase family protein [Candidatus Eisenbacteria sp.]|nr:recombinase family protein [Candidatus Eisenbacteria bacterium]
MRAAVYMRVSTEEQREKQTIKTQRQFAEQYCALHKIRIARTYEDDGITGTLPLGQRPAGAKLLADARQGLFDTVLLYKLDRLGRDALVTLSAVRDLEACGAKAKSMTEHFDSSDPSGRFMLTVLSGVGGLERDTFMERSRAGTERLAREGAWLGGIVAYGYRVEGRREHARLVISDDPLPGLPLSEADVIRKIFNLSAKEGWSCIQIAKHLTKLGIPPSYTLNGRKVKRAKRKQATAGVWWPGRIRNIITNTTYRGTHYYGRRTKKQRDVIERQVPPVVTEQIWNLAQVTLKKNRINATRNSTRPYLLRCLIKCGVCGLTYGGSCARGGKARYVCNGKRQRRGTFGKIGQSCSSMGIPAEIEAVVWSDVEEFLRDPGEVLRTLSEQCEDMDSRRSEANQEVELIEGQLADKDQERTRILTLFRKGTIEEALLEQQMAAIEKERTDLAEALEGARQRLRGLTQATTDLDSVETLLAELNGRLNGPLTFELKRELVETLVEGIVVETIERDGRKEALVHVGYKFDAPQDRIVTRTDRGSSPRRT